MNKGRSDVRQPLDSLIEQLRTPRDGRTLQTKMAPSAGISRYMSPRADARQAAVMIVLYPVGSRWHSIFIKRTSRGGDTHGGQIGLPGGRLELYESLEECALRETYEEVGIIPEDITIIGQLTDLYVYASNHIMYPFVGYVSEAPELIPSPDEVAHIYHTPLDYWSQQMERFVDFDLRGMVIPDMPYYDLHGEILWGATAMVFSEFLELWRRSMDYDNVQ